MTTDINTQSFLLRLPFLGPYAALARFDRPVGIWLLFWPCVFGVALSPEFMHADMVAQARLIGLFFVGAVVMRAAGCVVNDIWDRELDKRVARTATRPLASGAVTVWGALVFLGILLLCGAFVLWQLPLRAVVAGLCTLPFVLLYPVMKRVTWWPQIFLGVTFNAGIPVGWVAGGGGWDIVPVLLYVGAVLWTLGYDTVYACLDIRDDAAASIKSTARLWGMHVKSRVGYCLLAAIILMTAGFMAAGGTWLTVMFLALAGAFNLMAWKQWTPQNAAYTLHFFRFQAHIGLLTGLAALAPTVF